MTKSDMTQLVTRAQAGDKQAMNDLVSSCYQDLYYYAYKTVQDQELAADITQESFLEIITTLEKLREPGAFPVWARRIVYHQCTRHFRENREVTVSEDEDGETIFDRLPDESEGALPEQVQEDKEFQRTMQAMLDSLPAEQRSALLLYYYEKLSVGQIAGIQGVSDGTVKSRLNYGRKAVRAKVEEYEKKTGVRLHSLTPLPLLLLFLFGRDKETVINQTPPLPEAVSACLSSAKAATTVGVGLAVKIAAGIVAAALTIGLTVGGIAIAQKNAADKEGADEASISNPTVDPSVLASLPEIWYGDTYSDGNESDVLLLQEDGTVVVNGITYHITGIELLSGYVDIQHPQSTDRWELPTPGYRLSLTAEDNSRRQLDLLTVHGESEPVVAFLYDNYQIDGSLKYAVVDSYSVYAPEPSEPLPLELLEGLVGQWEYLPIDDTTYDDSFVLNGDGTVIYQGQTYYVENIRTDTDPDSGAAADSPASVIMLELSCDAEQAYPGLYIDFTRLSDGNYAAEMSGLIMGEGSKEINHFYRPDDYAGYEKILLTEENWQDYVTMAYGYVKGTNQETGEYHVILITAPYLTEDAAPISYFYGDVFYTTTYDEVTAYSDGTVEQTGHKPEAVSGSLGTMLVFGARNDLRLWCASEEVFDSCLHTHDFDEPPETEFVGNGEEGVMMLIPNFEQLWAENVTGCVYLPVN